MKTGEGAPWGGASSYGIARVRALQAALDRIAAFETDAVCCLTIPLIVTCLEYTRFACAGGRLREANEMRAAWRIVTGPDTLRCRVELDAFRRRYQPVEGSLWIFAPGEELIVVTADAHGNDCGIHEVLRIRERWSTVDETYLPDDRPCIDRKIVRIAGLDIRLRWAVVGIAVRYDDHTVRTGNTDS